jgi:hypothetical protein
MIELDIEHSQVPSVQPRHEAPSRLRPPQRSRVAGAQKYKYNTKYNTNTYNTKYTPPSGVLCIFLPWMRVEARLYTCTRDAHIWDMISSINHICGCGMRMRMRTHAPAAFGAVRACGTSQDSLQSEVYASLRLAIVRQVTPPPRAVQLAA